MGKITSELKVRPTTDGDAFNAVLNHPDVAPQVSLGGDVPDMSLYVQNKDNLCMMNQYGGFLCIQGPPTEYTVHTAFVPEGRGPYLIKSARYTAKKLFDRGASVLKTFVADDNAPARRLAEMVGFKPVTRYAANGVDGDIMFLRKEDICPQQSH